jgi:preprotein translocase subunit YajC
MDIFDFQLLSTQDLLDLNEQVIEELKKREREHHHQSLEKFNVGDRVYFDPEKGRTYGMVIRVNQKTLTIIDDNQMKWRVSPHLVSKEKKTGKKGKNKKKKSENVLPLFKN